MKKLCIVLACLVGGSLSAETVGNIEFEFPPSTNDWVLLTEHNEQEDNELAVACKVYTHKEGDALEVFTAVWVNEGLDCCDDEEDEEDEPSFLSTILNEQWSGYFPNHQIVILNQAGTDNAKWVEWEVNDGVQAVVNGLTRAVSVEGDYSVVLSYFTTAVKSDLNDAIWIDALNQALILE